MFDGGTAGETRHMVSFHLKGGLEDLYSGPLQILIVFKILIIKDVLFCIASMILKKKCGTLWFVFAN